MWMYMVCRLTVGKEVCRHEAVTELKSDNLASS
jgi:hypothetical protein